jgi:hypothetical protein
MVVFAIMFALIGIVFLYNLVQYLLLKGSRQAFYTSQYRELVQFLETVPELTKGDLESAWLTIQYEAGALF